jgi:transposase-like protein
MSDTSYRLDETYVKIGTEWKYLYRAMDSVGQTIEFTLSAKRDVSGRNGSSTILFGVAA